ncbi:transposase [Parapusillimonas sp. SGNA-6]|uniref:transposase n=1 Tax=Parapedobacter sp. SGR-10 TaxID=2710879 RepID=UPI0013D73340|nr:transposase [Parapedobacter sp. SGR-10]NGF55791.1 transposase [Parapedobacter sp. SGR-10]NGM90048.1 transposase [Parapusillimonas sp. SGNA-6]
MKKLSFVATLSVFIAVACQSPTTKEAVKGQQLAQEAIAVHDEIMPQIKVFDRTTIKIDSILNNLSGIANTHSDIDTAVLKTELQTLKTNLEDATENMMTWMREYEADNEDIEYQKSEVEKVKAMKKQFDKVAEESNKKLSSF